MNTNQTTQTQTRDHYEFVIAIMKALKEIDDVVAVLKSAPLIDDIIDHQIMLIARNTMALSHEIELRTPVQF